MANILTVTKFPPLEGGIASKSYWLARALARRGHTVHVVTDGLGEDPLHEIAGIREVPGEAGMKVHRCTTQVPWHIPEDRQRSMGLLDKTLEVVEREKPDVLEGSYLVPYGLVAGLVGGMTGIPYILRHGGSDINKFVRGMVWPTLFRNCFSKANKVVTDILSHSEVARWAEPGNVETLLPYIPDPVVFSASRPNGDNRPVLALVGKTNYHWKHKGWHRAVEILAHLKHDCRSLIVSQGVGFQDFRTFVIGRLGDSTDWRSFVAPWEMNDLLNSIDAVFCFDSDLPFPVYSNLFLEALSCGTTVILDRVETLELYRKHGIDLESLKPQICVIDRNDPAVSARLIRQHLEAQRSLAVHVFRHPYETYAASNETALLATISGNL